jgi:hypothetical protein
VIVARRAFFASKTVSSDENRLALNTDICESDLGRADLGLSYIELVEAFGLRGLR